MNIILEQLTNRTNYCSPTIIAVVGLYNRIISITNDLVQSKATFIRNDIVVSDGGGVYN